MKQPQHMLSIRQPSVKHKTLIITVLITATNLTEFTQLTLLFFIIKPYQVYCFVLSVAACKPLPSLANILDSSISDVPWPCYHYYSVKNFIQLVSSQPVNRFLQTKLYWKAPNNGYLHICGMYKSNNKQLRYQTISNYKSFIGYYFINSWIDSYD